MLHVLLARFVGSRPAICGLLLFVGGLLGGCQSSKTAFRFQPTPSYATAAPDSVAQPLAAVRPVLGTAGSLGSAAQPQRLRRPLAARRLLATHPAKAARPTLATLHQPTPHTQPKSGAAHTRRRPTEAGLGLTVIGLLGIPVAVIGLIGLLFGGGLVFVLMAVGGALALFLAYLVPILRRWWG